jgi:hypothetical protein
MGPSHASGIKKRQACHSAPGLRSSRGGVPQGCAAASRGSAGEEPHLSRKEADVFGGRWSYCVNVPHTSNATYRRMRFKLRGEVEEDQRSQRLTRRNRPPWRKRAMRSSQTMYRTEVRGLLGSRLGAGDLVASVGIPDAAPPLLGSPRPRSRGHGTFTSWLRTAPQARGYPSLCSGPGQIIVCALT